MHGQRNRPNTTGEDEILKEKPGMKKLIKKILVPIDGSEHADKALDYALDLAKKYDASIEVLNVVPTPFVRDT